MEYDKEIEERTGIFVFKNALTSDFCEEIIEAFKKTKNKQQGLTAQGYNPTVKNSIDWNIDIRKINEKLFSVLSICHEKIIEKHWILKSHNINYSGMQFQHTKPNEGYFKKHIDSNYGSKIDHRVLAPIFYLNNVDAGETNFPMQKISIKPETGKLVIFPATFQYLHEGKKSKSDKYIITTFGLIPCF